MATETPEAAMTRLAAAVSEAGKRRVLWENAKAAGDANIFAVAQAHRSAEQAVQDAASKAIDAVAARLRDIAQGVGVPAQDANSPKGDHPSLT